MAEDLPIEVERKLASMAATLEHVHDITRTFAPTATQVIEAQADAERALQVADDLKSWIRDVEGRLSKKIDGVGTSCKEIRADYNQFLEERRKSRITIIVAVIAASATVLAAVIAASAAILTSG